MAKYSGKPATIALPVQQVYERYSNLSGFEEKFNSLPEDQRSKIGEIAFEPDAITIKTPQVGEIKFQVVERIAPNKIVFGSPSSPVPMSLVLDLKEIDANTTEALTTIDVEIPAMLRPLIGGKLQEAADKFSEMMAQLSN